MKKIGKILIIVAILMIAFYFVYLFATREKANQQIDDYIEDTSIIEEDEEVEEPEIVEEEKPKRQINYTAVLEIPSINLKEGVVNNTKNFNSINYAVSVDNISQYPDENGNFILYAHSGSSSIAFFRNLNKININDKVYVYYDGIKYEYEIFDKYDIEKTGEASVLVTNTERYITLITCNQSHKGYQVVLIGKQTNQIKY